MSNDETLKRDELLLKILFRNYDEEVARNELIDSKNSQMIVLTGTMLTLQATLFTNVLLNEFIYSKISITPFNFWIYNLFITSIIFSALAMILFVLAYKFVGTFRQAPQVLNISLRNIRFKRKRRTNTTPISKNRKTRRPIRIHVTQIR